MEIIIGGVAFFAAQIIKKITQKKGVEFAKNSVLLVVFLIVFLCAFAVRSNFISMQTVDFVVKTFALAIAWYEVIWKGLLKNILQQNPVDQV